MNQRRWLAIVTAVVTLLVALFALAYWMLIAIYTAFVVIHPDPCSPSPSKAGYLLLVARLALVVGAGVLAVLVLLGRIPGMWLGLAFAALLALWLSYAYVDVLIPPRIIPVHPGINIGHAPGCWMVGPA